MRALLFTMIMIPMLSFGARFTQNEIKKIRGSLVNFCGSMPAFSTFKEFPSCGEKMTAAECKMFDLTNLMRKFCKLEPFQVSDRCVDAAREHVNDMSEHNYFDHRDSQGRRSWHRMEAHGIHARRAAENIAWNTRKQALPALLSLIRSAGHRKNLKNRELVFLGVGMTTTNYRGYKGLFWNQCFHGVEEDN